MPCLEFVKHYFCVILRNERWLEPMTEDKIAQRKIGSFTMDLPGPLLIIFGAIHGNESAGLEALKHLVRMIEVEPVNNPPFRYYGKMVALMGNLKAVAKNQRFIDEDLNRIWLDERVDIMRMGRPPATAEEAELMSLLDVIHQEVEAYQPRRIVFLDLHTTSSPGGIFAIPGRSAASKEIAQNLHAPVIKGMLEGIRGTTLHYLTEIRFGVPTDGVIFEGGQHEDPLSVNRCIAAIINCMRSIGAVKAEHVENIHDKILVDYSQSLPSVSHLLYKHDISEGDDFEMFPGYNNFQLVARGECIGRDKRGIVKAPFGGRIVMPLYQNQGNEGFFIVKEE